MSPFGSPVFTRRPLPGPMVETTALHEQAHTAPRLSLWFTISGPTEAAVLNHYAKFT